MSIACRTRDYSIVLCFALLVDDFHEDTVGSVPACEDLVSPAMWLLAEHVVEYAVLNECRLWTHRVCHWLLARWTSYMLKQRFACHVEELR